MLGLHIIYLQHIWRRDSRFGFEGLAGSVGTSFRFQTFFNPDIRFIVLILDLTIQPKAHFRIIGSRDHCIFILHFQYNFFQLRRVGIIEIEIDHGTRFGLLIGQHPAPLCSLI